MSEWKETELGRIPSTWDAIPIGEIADVTKLAGFEYTKHFEYVDDGEIIALRALNVRDGVLDLSDIKKIQKHVSDALIRSKLFAGDILFTYVGANIGQFALIPEDNKYHLAPNICRIRAGDRYLSYFLYSYFRTPYFKENLANYSVGSSQPTMPMGNIRRILVPLPPLSEQKAIAGVLSSLDDKIDLLHRQNKTLEALAETLFRQWFVEEAREDWAEGCLGDYVEVMRGLSYKGSGLSEVGLGLPMHNLNSVYEGGGYKYEGIKYYSGDYKERHLVYPGDVIVTNTEQGHEHRLIGCPAIVPRFFGKFGLFSQHVFRLRLLGNHLTVPFLYHLLMSNDVREQITGATNGSTVNMLPKDGIEWARFRVPPPSKIQAFTAISQPCIDKSQEIHTSIHTLEKLRDTLLPKLMSGEVRVG